MIELAGSTDLACHLVFEVERRLLAVAEQRRRGHRKPVRIGSAWGGRTTTIIHSVVRGGSFPA